MANAMLENAQLNAFKSHPHLNEPFSSTRLDDEHLTHGIVGI